MAKFRIILSICAVVLLANEGCCLERITIRQFLAFLDRITSEYTEIYKSISKPNDAHFPDEIDIYKSPNFREYYDGIPKSIKNLMENSRIRIRVRRAGEETPATNSTDGSSTANTPTSQSPAAPSMTSTSSSPTTTSPVSPTDNVSPSSGSTHSPSDKSSASLPATTPSSGTVFTGPSLVSSASTSYITQTSSTDIRYSTSRIVPGVTTSSPHMTSRLPEMSTSVSETTSTATPETTTTTDSELLTDKHKVIDVLDNLARFGITWARPVRIYKFKLEVFDKRLNGNFPSTIAQKISARILAKVVKIAKPFFRYRIDEIIAEANRKLVTMQNGKRMKQAIQLLTTISMLPDILTQSLVG